MKERLVLFAPEARNDLITIYDWVASVAGLETALGFVERLESFCRSMNVASERGHRRDDIRPGLRIIGFERRITAAFTVSETKVTILRLFYAGRDWERVLE